MAKQNEYSGLQKEWIHSTSKFNIVYKREEL